MLEPAELAAVWRASEALRLAVRPDRAAARRHRPPDRRGRDHAVGTSRPRARGVAHPGRGGQDREGTHCTAVRLPWRSSQPAAFRRRAGVPGAPGCADPCLASARPRRSSTSGLASPAGATRSAPDARHRDAAARRAARGDRGRAQPRLRLALRKFWACISATSTGPRSGRRSTPGRARSSGSSAAASRRWSPFAVEPLPGRCPIGRDCA